MIDLRWSLVAAVLALLLAGALGAYGPGASGTRAPAGTGTGIANAAVAQAQASLATGSPAWHRVMSTVVPPRAGAEVLVYDAADHYVLMFGGRDKWTPFNAPFIGGTWSFANGTWTLLQPTTAPTARGDAAAAYDASDGYVVLFGGLRQGGGPMGGGSLYDTWTFHAGQWTQLKPGVHPGVDEQSAMAYDPAIQRVIMYGGTTAGGNQTWMFHAGRWTLLHPSTSPPGLRLAKLTYYAPASELLLYGGCSGGGCVPVYNATWAFAHGTWTQLRPLQNPGPRFWYAMAYDPSLHSVVLFGGSNRTSLQSDTWLFTSGNWSLFCAHCGPSARYIPVSTYDPSANAVVLYGGSAAGGFSNQTWEFR